MTQEQLARLQELYDQSSWTGLELREMNSLMRLYYPYAVEKIADLEDNEIVLCRDLTPKVGEEVNEVEIIDF